jgi:hypothetical protein
MRAAGGPAVQVTKQGGLYSQESPDGKFLNYSKGQSQRAELWRAALTGGEETRVLESMTSLLNFELAEDGVYFTTRKPNGVLF